MLQDMSLFWAGILGPLYVVVGVSILINRAFFEQMIDTAFDRPLEIYLSGLIAFFFGMTIVLTHNDWGAHWSVAITIIGWLGLIKGIGLLLLPHGFKGFTTALKSFSAFFPIMGGVAILLGAWLSWSAYGAA